MNSLIKIILATSLINAIILGGVAAKASTKSSQADSVISQRAKGNQIAEASDGDGEMNDALEAQLEKKNSQENASTQVSESDRNPKASEDDPDGTDETRENPNEPNDRDGGDETKETR